MRTLSLQSPRMTGTDVSAWQHFLVSRNLYNDVVDGVSLGVTAGMGLSSLYSLWRISQITLRPSDIIDKGAGLHPGTADSNAGKPAIPAIETSL